MEVPAEQAAGLVTIGIQNFGFHEAANNFRQMGQDMMVLELVLQLISQDMMAVTGRVFESQGRRGGGSWQRLSTQWLRRKERSGGDPRIGFFRHDLYESLTVPGDRNQFLQINAEIGTIRFGSRLPYAGAQQKHRPYLKFTPQDKRRWSNMITGDVKDKWQKRARKR